MPFFGLVCYFIYEMQLSWRILILITSPSQPAVYIAESAISSGTAGSSADGSENTVAFTAGIALVSIAAASAIVLSLGKNQPVVQTADYSGPSLSYYISKFTPPPAAVEVSAPPLQTETSAQEVSQQPEVQADSQQETTPVWFQRLLGRWSC